MRGFAVLAAIFAALMALTPGPALAYRTTPVTLVPGLMQDAGLADRWERDRRWDRGRDWRRDRRWRDRRGWNRGRTRWRTVCHNQWRGGYRERVCRRVRYRR